MNTPAGTILYDYKLPVKGVSKKVIYHISDIHLNCSDFLMRFLPLLFSVKTSLIYTMIKTYTN